MSFCDYPMAIVYVNILWEPCLSYKLTLKTLENRAKVTLKIEKKGKKWKYGHKTEFDFRRDKFGKIKICFFTF